MEENFSPNIDNLTHDRYLVYTMIGKSVSFFHKNGRVRHVSGIVQAVERDVLENQVEITVDGKIYVFPEPAIVTASGGKSVAFVYGKRGQQTEESDRDIFSAMREDYGQSLNDVLHRTAPVKPKVTRFMLAKAS